MNFKSFVRICIHIWKNEILTWITWSDHFKVCFHFVLKLVWICAFPKYSFVNWKTQTTVTSKILKGCSYMYLLWLLLFLFQLHTDTCIQIVINTLEHFSKAEEREKLAIKHHKPGKKTKRIYKLTVFGHYSWKYWSVICFCVLCVNYTSYSPWSQYQSIDLHRTYINTCTSTVRYQIWSLNILIFNITPLFDICYIVGCPAERHKHMCRFAGNSSFCQAHVYIWSLDLYFNLSPIYHL